MDIVCAIAVALQPSMVIETGTFEGRTTGALFHALSRHGLPTTLVTVESDPRRSVAAREAGKDWAGSVNLRWYQMDAVDALMGFDAGSVDMVFLDDDHTATHVELELMETMRILRPGGVCLVHDVCGPFGLDRLVRRFGGVCLDLPRLHVAGGLGVIVK